MSVLSRWVRTLCSVASRPLALQVDLQQQHRIGQLPGPESKTVVQQST